MLTLFSFESLPVSFSIWTLRKLYKSRLVYFECYNRGFIVWIFSVIKLSVDWLWSAILSTLFDAMDDLALLGWCKDYWDLSFPGMLNISYESEFLRLLIFSYDYWIDPLAFKPNRCIDFLFSMVCVYGLGSTSCYTETCPFSLVFLSIS